jgi:hypothetical protein
MVSQSPTTQISRWQPLSGIAFVVFFLAGVVASSPPKDSASDASWIANYTGNAHKAGHIVTGVCLILAGLCLMSFITALWMRLTEANAPRRFSPLPVIAAGIAAACMAVGGVLMGAAVSLVGSGFTPNADVLRLCNDVGFAMVGLAGMLAAALSVASLSLQARAVGYFSQKMTVFSLAVAVILLASLAFIPIAALMIWLLIVSVRWMRSPNLASGL